MSNGLNKVMLLGYLGADPELRHTQSGQAVMNVRLATTESYLDKDKQRQERTDWHTVVVWGNRAEALAKILSKGAPIFVEGSLRTSSYDDRDGNKRYRTDVHASNIILMGRKDGAQGSAGDGGSDGGDYQGGYGNGSISWTKESDGDFTIPFGRAKGEKVSEADDENLEWLLKAFEKDLDDDSKSKYHPSTRKRIASIKIVLAARAGGSGGAASNGHQNGGGGRGGGYGRRSAPAPRSEAPPDDFGGYGGGGYGSDDDIPF